MSTGQTIGIVACSSEGAALCYRTICTRGPVSLGPHRHPEILLHSSPLRQYVDALESGDLPAVAELMLASAQILAAAGADFLICPDNTIHAAMDLVRPASPLPWLHIAEIVAAEARRSDVRKVAILGTKWLVESDVYPGALDVVGIDYMLPEPQEREEMGRIIMEELVNDVQLQDSVRYFVDLIERMRDRGCDAAILGCTEIPLIISDDNSPLTAFDSTRLLADAALRFAVTSEATR